MTITRLYPVTINDPALTEAMLPTLTRVAGAGMVVRAAAGHSSRRFFVLHSKSAGPVHFSRSDEKGRGRRHHTIESLASFRSGRGRAATRRPDARQSRRRLSVEAMNRFHARIATIAICLVSVAAPLRAQGVEVMPFGGYRFGGDFFELVAEHPVDLDGSPALGFVLNVPLWDGLQVEALVTRQSAHVSIPATPLAAATRWNVTIDHMQAGGLREFSSGRVRPFLTGLLGLTHYAAEGNSELRFTTGAGGGVKLFPVSQFGLRLDGRLYATFVDANMRFLACRVGTCITAINTDVVWQAEFTAGLVVRLR